MPIDTINTSSFMTTVLSQAYLPETATSSDDVSQALDSYAYQVELSQQALELANSAYQETAGALLNVMNSLSG